MYTVVAIEVFGNVWPIHLLVISQNLKSSLKCSQLPVY